MPFVRVVSDLHLEWYPGETYQYAPYIPSMPEDKDTILVLAGDICEIAKPENLKLFLDDVCGHFKAVIYVFGNHEHYHGDINETLKKFKEQFDYNNLYVLDKDVVVLDGVAFIGTTLWTNIRKGNPLSVREAYKLRDYSKIITGTRELTPLDTMGIHTDHLAWLEEALVENCDLPCVVVTHHAPCDLSIADRFRGDSLNGCFVSDLSEVIFAHSPKIWIHGHCHDTFDYRVYDTRVICNPAGYFQSVNSRGNPIYENAYFNPLLRLDL